MVLVEIDVDLRMTQGTATAVARDNTLVRHTDRLLSN
jgi:hypothetical protein